MGDFRRKVAPALILTVAMVLVAFQAVPVAIAFFGDLAMVLTGAIRMREAYGALDAPLLILIAALIPISDAIRATGGADLIAGLLAGAFDEAPPMLAPGGRHGVDRGGLATGRVGVHTLVKPAAGNHTFRGGGPAR